MGLDNYNSYRLYLKKGCNKIKIAFEIWKNNINAETHMIILDNLQMIFL